LDGKDGIRPYGSLARDATGNLFGTTNLGGKFGLGTVFEITPHSNGRWTERVIHHFNANGTDGYNPNAGVAIDAAGNLFGTTYNGGKGSSGVVFKLSEGPNGAWKELIVHSFVYSDGAASSSGLAFNRVGHLFGTTEYGGDFQHGTVFELAPQSDGSWTQRVIHSFNPADGDGFNPRSGLVIDKSNRLYGTTLYGGSSFAWGAVFELRQVKGLWQERVIHSFSQDNDGISPYGPLAIDSAGRLYGMTYQSIVGGVGGAGIVFQLSRTTTNNFKETILHHFVSPGDGGNPYSGLAIAASGKIFGTTYNGGAPGGTGVVFEITK